MAVFCGSLKASLETIPTLQHQQDSNSPLISPQTVVVSSIEPVLSSPINIPPCSFNRDVHIEAPPLNIELISKIRTMVLEAEPILATEDLWVMNDRSIWRYLTARKLDLNGTKKQIVASLKWRQLNNPNSVTPTDVQRELETGKIAVRGVDQFLRPVLVLDSSKENTFDYEGNMKALIFNLNRAVHMLQFPVQKYVVVVRLGDTSMFDFSKLPGPQQVRETIKILMTVFAERMGHAILYQPPKIFTAFLNLISNIMDPHIFEKVVWIKGDVSVGSKNDVTMRMLLGENWRVLVGEGQPVHHVKWAPGYDSPVEWEKVLREWNERDKKVSQ